MRWLILGLLSVIFGGVARAADLKWGAGGFVGGAIPRSPLGPTLAPHLEATVVLPVAEGRLRPVLTVGWARLSAEGVGEDDAVGGAYDWRLVETVVPVGLGLTARPLQPGGPTQLELTVQPQWVWMSTATNGSASGAEFGVTRERSAAVGLLAAAGVSRDVGLGEVVGALAYAVAPLKGTLTGEGALHTLTPTLGFRFWF